ncbi:MAG: RecX family transcriptional regulator, partial [Alphaproteobacteria bacterium]|nr:RecX family transcriptional regulator [Alphaproteobacteria bacterium]
ADDDAEHGIEGREKDAALTVARKKKIGPFRGTKEKNPQKELSAMARAGFSYDLAKAIVDVDEEF